jgi:hypothetical protein
MSERSATSAPGNAEKALPEGVEQLPPAETSSFLRKFPGHKNADASGEPLGFRIDLCGEHVSRNLLLVFASVVFALIKLEERMEKETFLPVVLVAVLLLAVCAAYIVVNDVVLVFQSGHVFYRRRHGFRSTRRRLRAEDIQAVIHNEHKSGYPDMLHWVEFLLAGGEKLFLFNADMDRETANRFLVLMRTCLAVPVEVETSFGFGCNPEDLREQEPEQERPSGMPCGGFLPDDKKANFPELSLLLPGTSAYKRFHRKIRFTSPPQAEQSGFFIREEKFTVRLCFAVVFGLYFIRIPIMTGATAAPTGTDALAAFAIALAVSVPASLLTKKKCLFFVPDMLLLCKNNGMILQEIPRKSIADVHAKGFWGRRERWTISLETDSGEIPLMTFRNTKAAKWLVDTTREWMNAEEKLQKS